MLVQGEIGPNDIAAVGIGCCCAGIAVGYETRGVYYVDEVAHAGMVAAIVIKGVGCFVIYGDGDSSACCFRTCYSRSVFTKVRVSAAARILTEIEGMTGGGGTIKDELVDVSSDEGELRCLFAVQEEGAGRCVELSSGDGNGEIHGSVYLPSGKAIADFRSCLDGNDLTIGVVAVAGNGTACV